MKKKVASKTKRKIAKRPTRKRAPRKSKPAADGCPVELLGDVARDWWRRLEPDLRNRLNLLSVDRGALILLCNAWQRLTEVQRVLAKQDRYPVTGENGYRQIHPAASEELKLSAQITRLQAELGMSIKSRKGVRVKAGDADPINTFLAGGK